MSLVNVFLIVSSLVWFLPLYKQRNTLYWNYFLVLAITDPLVFIIRTLVKVNSSYLCLFFIVLMISSIQEKKNIISITIIGIIFTVLLKFLFYQPEFINLIVVIYILILLCAIALKLVIYLKKNLLNLFLSLLLFYNIINLSKFLEVLFNKDFGMISFYLGYTFQIIFGILFSFININTINLNLNFKFLDK